MSSFDPKVWLLALAVSALAEFLWARFPVVGVALFFGSALSWWPQLRSAVEVSLGAALVFAAMSAALMLLIGQTVCLGTRSCSKSCALILGVALLAVLG